MPVSSVLRQVLKTFPYSGAVRRIVSEVASRTSGSGREIVSTIYTGQKMCVDLADYIGQEIAAVGSFEVHMTQLVASQLRPGDTFIDVGAHMGFYSIVVSPVVGPSGQVHAFEPGEKQHRLLTENTRINNLTNVTVNKVGVSNARGRATFVEGPSRNLGESHISENPGGSGPSIELVTLDDYCQEHSIKSIGGMKVDVEGLEEFVFLGASHVLSVIKPRFIIYESVAAHAAKFNSSPEKVHEILRKNGYRIQGFNNRKLFDLDSCARMPHDFFATLA